MNSSQGSRKQDLHVSADVQQPFPTTRLPQTILSTGVKMRVVQYSKKFMHGIVLRYIHLTTLRLTIQYNREQSNTIECNTMPCINLSEY